MKVSLHILTKEKDVQAIEDAISDAERELGVKSKAIVGKSRSGAPPGMEKFVVDVATAFVMKFIEKYGESFANWLARKLGLDESKGEDVSETG